MKLKVVLIAVLVVFSLFVIAGIASLDWQKKEIEIGFHSDVAKDNFTMAKRLLKANGIDWNKNKRAVIQRVLERGNKEEIQELINFYGKQTIFKVIQSIKKSHLPSFEENIKRYNLIE